MSQFLVFDASHLMYRNYHVAKSLPAVDESNIVNTSVYMFFNSVFSELRGTTMKPLFLFDAPSSTKARKELDDSYKSNRVANPVIIQIKLRILDYLKRFNLPFAEMVGFEADDLAYYLSRFCSNFIKFISEDVDWYAFVTQNTQLVRPISEKTITFQTLLKKYEPVIDEILKKRTLQEFGTIQDLVHLLINQTKAIRGDGSDNIKGFDGIGPKSCTKLLSKINSVPTIEEFTPKGKAETNFKKSLDRYHNNMKVLGYFHVDEADLKPVLHIENNIPEDLESLYDSFCNELDSKSFKNRKESILSILQNTYFEAQFNWI